MSDPVPVAGYRLIVSGRIDERDGKPRTRFTIETVRQFTEFPYALEVKETIGDATIRFVIAGLTPLENRLEKGGGARYSREFTALNGRYTVVVRGIDRKEAACTLSISGASVELLEGPAPQTLQVLITEATE
jgi:hypothetical protein